MSNFNNTELEQSVVEIFDVSKIEISKVDVSKIETSKVEMNIAVSKVESNEIVDIVKNELTCDLNTITLDKASLSQLTFKKIKSTSTSKWCEMVKLLYSQYAEPADKQDVNVINLIGLAFVDQLLLDNESDQKISDCALFAPRSRCKFNRKDQSVRLTNFIVNELFVGDNKKVKGFQIQNFEDKKTNNFSDSITCYSKLISKLTKQYIVQYTQEYIENNKFNLHNIIDHTKQNWCSIKNRPLSSFITEPRAMEVNVAPLEELEDFMKFLNSDGDLIINDIFDMCMTFKRGTLYQDKRLDLCKQVVGPIWIEMLMKALANNSFVEHFLLGNNIIGPIGGKAVRDYLKLGKSKIKTWYLAGNDLNSEAIGHIVDGLIDSNDHTCTQLWLKRNPLKLEGIKHIARLVEFNTTIEVLDLHNTAILDDGLKILMNSMKSNRSIKKLYLDANGITEKGVDYLVDYFTYMIEIDVSGVTALWLDMNKLHDEGVSKLVRVLANYKYLTHLILGSNGITEECIEIIVCAFTYHPNLLVLDIGMYKSTSDMGMVTNKIGDLGASKLSILIKLNKTIKYLSVMMNGISFDGIQLLIDALDNNESIVYFDYDQYGMVGQRNNDIKVQVNTRLKINKTKSDWTMSLRDLKHGSEIKWIDSIYRNSAK